MIVENKMLSIEEVLSIKKGGKAMVEAEHLRPGGWQQEYKPCGG